MKLLGTWAMAPKIGEHPKLLLRMVGQHERGVIAAPPPGWGRLDNRHGFDEAKADALKAWVGKYKHLAYAEPATVNA